MLHEELNVIGSLVLTHTGIKVFNQSNTKPEKINKLIENMKTSSQKTNIHQEVPEQNENS